MTHRSLPAITLLALAACNSIPVASATTPRSELEVAVVIAPEFVQQLQAMTPDLDASLRRSVERAVIDQADVGMRFYPILSSEYEKAHSRPEFLLTIHLGSLTFRATSANEYSAAGVASLHVGLAAELLRRREKGPSLPVSHYTSSGTARPSSYRDVEAHEASYLVSEGNGPRLPVTESVITGAVTKAVRESLAEMLAAIDREVKK